MGNLLVRFKRLSPDAVIPTRSHDSAGYDLFSAEDKMLHPLQTKVIKLGFAAAFAPDFVGLIWDRSGLATKGIHRFAGVIDHDYRDEWGVVLVNISTNVLEVKKGMRIAQVLFQQRYDVDFLEVPELEETSRKGGFGSTGD